MSRIVRQLGVWLNDVRVGRLTLDDQALCEFVLNETYRQMLPRPVLGQQFEDDLQKRHHARSRLPRGVSPDRASSRTPVAGIGTGSPQFSENAS